MKSIFKRDFYEFFSVSNFIFVILLFVLIFNFFMNEGGRSSYDYSIGNASNKQGIFDFGLSLATLCYFLFLVYRMFLKDSDYVKDLYFTRIEKGKWMIIKFISIFLFFLGIHLLLMGIYMLLTFSYKMPINIGDIFIKTIGIVIVRYSFCLFFLLLYSLFKRYSIFLIITLLIYGIVSDFQSFILYQGFHLINYILLFTSIFILYKRRYTFFMNINEAKKEIE